MSAFVAVAVPFRSSFMNVACRTFVLLFFQKKKYFFRILNDFPPDHNTNIKSPWWRKKNQKEISLKIFSLRLNEPNRIFIYTRTKKIILGMKQISIFIINFVDYSEISLCSGIVCVCVCTFWMLKFSWNWIFRRLI